jgi:hypothetical protein
MRERTEELRDRLPGTLPDLLALGRLVGDAVIGVTDVVEDVHRTVASVSPVVGRSRPGRTRGITGLVYRGVRGVTAAVAAGLDAAAVPLGAPDHPAGVPSPGREAARAALNGVYGDYLVASGNPLAIPMRFRQDGRPLTLDRGALRHAIARPSGRLLVMIHGLCMNDLQWQRGAHDHGAALGDGLGYTPLYLHYNSGQRVSVNGRQLADLLESLVAEWPVNVRELTVVGHSMGGLVARSAHHYAVEAGHTWPDLLRHLVFLGTPHHGAPLERAGNRFNAICGISPYTAPIARIGARRSAGVQDLRFGNLLDEDWQDRDGGHAHDGRRPVPLPEDVRCFAIAASLRREPGARGGDGLVPVWSALGQHLDRQRALRIPARHRFVAHGSNHFDLLGSSEVHARIRAWLSGVEDRRSPGPPVGGASGSGR